MRLLSLLTFLALCLASARSVAEDPPTPIRVLIIDGQNNHNWQQTTPVLKKILSEAGRFTVGVATSPQKLNIPPLAKTATPEEARAQAAKVAPLRSEHLATMEKFHPDLTKYQVASNTVAYGKGRVFHTPMGHDANAMRCYGFAATLQRGTEWAVTGSVTIPLPKEFPTAEKTSPIPEK